MSGKTDYRSKDAITIKGVMMAITALILTAPWHGMAAEAFGASNSYFVWPSLLSPKGRITVRKPTIAPPQSRLTYLSLFGQISALPPAQTDSKTALSPEPERRAEIFADTFIKADSYHLIPLLNDGSYGEFDVILDKATLQQFATLPATATALTNRHLTQSLLDEPFIIWPARSSFDAITGERLVYEVAPIIIQSPLTAEIAFNTAPHIFMDFSGTIRLSFIDDEARILLAAGAQSLSLDFDIQHWRDRALIHSNATLYHNQKRYQAAVTLAHTSLPDPALLGAFIVPGPADDGPVSGQFRNFELPDK